MVYLKTIPRFQELIRRDGYELLEPATAGTQELRPEDAPRWLAEAQRAVAAAPQAWSPLQYLSKSLLALNRLEESAEATRKLLEIVPEAYFAWAELGYLYKRMGDENRAAEAFRRCAEIRPDYGPCRPGQQ